MPHKPTRRTFLKAAGVSVALPALDIANLGRAAAQAPPPRTVFICTALGLHGPALYPQAAGKDLERTEYLDLLWDHRRDLTLFSGLSHPDQGGEHATERTFLSAARNPGQDGFRNSISVDQVAAQSLGYVTRFPSVMLSSNGPASQSYTSSGVMVPAEHSPARMFAKLFLQGNQTEINRQKHKLQQGKSILDELLSQTKALRARASAADRERLDEYLASIRAAERDLVASQTWLGRPKPQVEQEQPRDIYDKADLIGRTKLLLNLIPLIIQSDSSRVISVMIQDHQVVPQIEGVSLEHHNLSHHGRDEVKIEQLKRIERSLVSCLGDFLGQMRTKQDTAGSLLDHTAIMFGSNLGNANAHDPRNLPILMAGGGFSHGQYIAHDARNNTPLCNLFVTLLRRMGVKTNEFASSTSALEW